MACSCGKADHVPPMIMIVLPTKIVRFRPSKFPSQMVATCVKSGGDRNLPITCTYCSEEASKRVPSHRDALDVGSLASGFTRRWIRSVDLRPSVGRRHYCENQSHL